MENKTILESHITGDLDKFNTFVSQYCPTQYKQLCRDISDELGALRMRKQWLMDDIARLRQHIDGYDRTVPTVAAGMQQRGVEALPEG